MQLVALHERRTTIRCLSLCARYLRSPEFVLAIIDFLIVLVLFGFEAIDWIADEIEPAFAILPFSAVVNEWIFIGVLLGFLATVMLPISWVVLLAAVLEVVSIDDESTFVLLALPSSVLWGFGVAFLYRVLKTSSYASARAATLHWRVRVSPAVFTPCPHCGQPMPVGDEPVEANAVEANDVEVNDAGVEDVE